MRSIAVAACSLLLVALVLLPQPPVAHAQLANSPWPTSHHDAAHTGRSNFDTSKNTGTLKWKSAIANGGGDAYANPAIGADGTIYTGCNDAADAVLCALNPDGTQKWVFSTGSSGVAATNPAIGSDGTIFFLTINENAPRPPDQPANQTFYAVNPDGTQKWAFAFGFVGNRNDDPVIGADGTIYIEMCAATVGGVAGFCGLFAINPDGTEKWQLNFTAGPPFSSTHAGQFVGASTPAIGADGTVYSQFDDQNVYAVNPDGTLKWEFVTGIASGGQSAGLAVGTDHTVLITDNNNLYAVYDNNPNPALNGTLKWIFGNSALNGGSPGPPSIGADGTIYVGTYENAIVPPFLLYAVNPDGTQKWAFPTLAPPGASSPAIGSDGTIYFGSFDDNVYAVNPDGTEKWAFPADTALGSSPSIGADGTVYVSSIHGLYALAAPAVEQLVVNPSKLNFGTVSVGTTSASQTATITSEFSDDRVDFFGTFIMGNFIKTGSTCGASLGPLQSCQISFACKPKTTGSLIGAYAFLYSAVQVSGIMDGDDYRKIGVVLFTCTGG